MNLRSPPHSIEGEQSVLGCLMLDPRSYDRIADLLSESDFYRHEHRQIWSACVELVTSSKPCDVIAVFERLQASGKDEDVGGLVYLNQLAMSIPSAANVRHYAGVVRERAILRKLIATSDEIATAAFSHQGRPASDLLAEAEAKVLAIGEASSKGASNTQHDAGPLMMSLLDRVSELHDKGAEEVTGLRTGFVDLDRKLSGLQRGDLIVVAARPSMGKTALAVNIAEHAAIKCDAAVLIFSMEMGASQLALRMASSVGRVHGMRLRTGRMMEDEWGRLAEAVDRIGRARIRIDEAAAMTVGELRAKARRTAREFGGLGLVVVDYLQLMSGGGKENRATELGEISRGLKAMAKELGCPVIALSQLNRSVESRNDKRPTMSDLRESGAIEQDADVILFIYRDDYYTKDSCKEPGVAEIIISKHRNGETGTVRLAWLGGLTRFDNLAQSS